MKTSEFDFHLPEQSIAQHPAADRDGARLLVIDHSAKNWSDRVVRELPEILRAGDLLVLNDTRVIPARLRSIRDSSGGKVEILLLPPEPGDANDEAGTVTRRVLLKSGGRIKPGETVTLKNGPRATILENLGETGYRMRFACSLPDFTAGTVAGAPAPSPGDPSRACSAASSSAGCSPKSRPASTCSSGSTTSA